MAFVFVYSYLALLIGVNFKSVTFIHARDFNPPSTLMNDESMFQNILEFRPCNSVLELKNMIIERQALLKWLQNCSNLKTLRLINISLTVDSNKIKKRANLPNLETFHLELNSEIFFENSFELESLIVFQKNHSDSHHGLKDLNNLDFHIAGNFGPGYLRLENGAFEGTHVNDSAVWLLLQDVWSSFRTVKIKYSKFKAEFVNMSMVEDINLEHNEIIDGKLADVFKYAKVATNLEIYSSKDEAIDLALLPSNSLRSVITWQLSFRWSSQSSIRFPVLEILNMTFGDIDINLFHVSESFDFLWLDHIHLWNSTVRDIKTRMPNLQRLAIGCQFFQGVCPTIDLSDIPSRDLTALVLNNVDLTVREPEISFTEIQGVGLVRCRINEKVLKHFDNFFPNVGLLVLSVNDVLRDPKFIQKLQNSKISRLSISVVISTRDDELLKFIEIIKNAFNISLPFEKLGGGVGVELIRNGVTWVYNFAPYPIHRLLRIIRLLEILNYNTSNITQSTLDSIYYSYTSIVYLICIVGMICNLLCAVVLFQKTMRTSTGCLMLSLAISDFFYLFASMFTVEEFQLLFNYEYVLSYLYVYPLKMTAYTASIYITILITVERFVAICFPFHLSSLFAVKRTIRYIGGAVGFAVVLCFPRWFESIKWSYAASSSEWSSNYPKQLHRIPAYNIIYQNIIWYLFIHAVPLCSIAVLNFVIAIKARKAAEKRRALASKSGSTEDNSLTKVLLLVVLIFFICNALSGIINWIFVSKNVEPEVVESLASFPAIINSSLNFILYYVMGTKFRKEFKGVFLQLWQKFASTLPTSDTELTVASNTSQAGTTTALNSDS